MSHQSQPQAVRSQKYVCPLEVVDRCETFEPHPPSRCVALFSSIFPSRPIIEMALALYPPTKMQQSRWRLSLRLRRHKSPTVWVPPLQGSYPANVCREQNPLSITPLYLPSTASKKPLRLRIKVLPGILRKQKTASKRRWISLAIPYPTPCLSPPIACRHHAALRVEEHRVHCRDYHHTTHHVFFC